LSLTVDPVLRAALGHGTCAHSGRVTRLNETHRVQMRGRATAL